MDPHQLHEISTLCAASLVIGESALLLFGMNVPTVSSWSTRRNITLAASDILLGGILACAAVAGRAAGGGWVYLVAACVLVASHLFRDVEYAAGWQEPFAGSPALLVFNNVRLVLLGMSLALTLK